MLLVHLFVCFARVYFGPFSLPLGVEGWLRFAIVAYLDLSFTCNCFVPFHFDTWKVIGHVKLLPHFCSTCTGYGLLDWTTLHLVSYSFLPTNAQKMVENVRTLFAMQDVELKNVSFSHERHRNKCFGNSNYAFDESGYCQTLYSKLPLE